MLVGEHIADYLRYFFEHWTVQRSRLQDSIPDYIAALSSPGALRAGFDDYRATTVDLEHDAADLAAGRSVEIPVQALWGESGLPAGMDVLAAWKPFAPNVFGQSIPDCGHFLPEEQPEALLAQLQPYLSS